MTLRPPSASRRTAPAPVAKALPPAPVVAPPALPAWLHARWARPALALLTVGLLPALLRGFGSGSAPGDGFLFFLAIVLGFATLLAGALLALWWLGSAWQHRDDDPLAPRWRFGEGPNALSRHPAWLAAMLLVAGQAIVAMSVAMLVYAALVMVAANWAVRRIDEPQLLAQGGDDYRDYAARVPRWLPWTGMATTLREIGTMLRDTLRSR